MKRLFDTTTKLKHLMKIRYIPPKALTDDTMGNILDICVKVGQNVEKGDEIMDILTDKHLITEESPVSGQIKDIYVKSLDFVKEGEYLYSIDSSE